MNGWFALGLLSILSLSALVFFVRSSKGLWQVATAAVLLGMTGYALQGRPALPPAAARGQCRWRNAVGRNPCGYGREFWQCEALARNG